MAWSQKSSSNRQQEVEGQLAAAQKVFAELEKQGHDLVLKRQQLNETIASPDQKIAQKSELKDQNEQTYLSIRDKLRQISAQVEGPERIKDRREGYYYGIKYVLDHQGDSHGIVGVIGELTPFPAELEVALSTALDGGV